MNGVLVILTTIITHMQVILFKEMSVQRLKSKAICYLGPLPDDLPKPAHLKAELQGVCMVERLITVLPQITTVKKK